METAYEAALRRVRELTVEIAELQQKKKWALSRVERYRGKSILECERVATFAEAFQMTSLPELPE